MRTPPLLADFTHIRVCKPFCENSLTLPYSVESVDKIDTTISAGTEPYRKGSPERELRIEAPGYRTVTF